MQALPKKNRSNVIQMKEPKLLCRKHKTCGFRRKCTKKIELWTNGHAASEKIYVPNQSRCEGKLDGIDHATLQIQIRKKHHDGH